MGWMVRASGGEEIFSILPDRVRGPHSLLYNAYLGPILGLKWPGRGVDHPPHLLLKLKRGYSYSSIPPPHAIMTCCRVHLNFLQGTLSRALQLTTYPSSAKIKNEWSYHPFPHTSLRQAQGQICSYFNCSQNM